jgi:nitroreductase
VLFVCYDKTVCWQHPQNEKSSGATDATIVATHMMLEAASIGLGTVWISYFDEDKARRCLICPIHGNLSVCSTSAIPPLTLSQIPI